MRTARALGLLALAIAAPDCKRTVPPPHRAPAAPSPPAPPPPDLDALPDAKDLPPERRAIQVVHGVERTVDAELARQKGLTLVDLSDGWAPRILDDAAAPDGSILPDRYRPVFVGLANDRTDGDGQPLVAGQKNYLELYGVPPSLSVLRERFLADAARTCEKAVDLTKLAAVDSVETHGSTTERQEATRHRLRGLRLEQARAKLGAETLAALGEKEPRYAKEVKTHLRIEAERAAFAEIEKLLPCLGFFDPKKHRPGRYDAPMRTAMLDFQRRNVLFDQSDINHATIEALQKPALEADFAALKRVLTERAVHAGGFVEDGSVPPHRKKGPATYKGKDGRPHPVPNLTQEATDALVARLGLATPADAVGFFRRHPPSDFERMQVAVRFPRLPEYYGPHMDLSAEIDRGDVWYEFPFNDKGDRLSQPRERFPSLTLFVTWEGERVPLVKWRTTIGGWRSELAADGEEYYRYKVSDVGPRVWRHLVAAPVWIPPPSSPLGGMVKEKQVNGAFVKVTNYDETGPGYLSAYGLAAAIHEKVGRGPDGPRYHDNGIRTHGSFDYASLRGRFSHGCHRLYNNLALRLFSALVKHRKHKTLGSVALGFRQFFWWRGEVFDMRLPTRGFYYEMDPPVPVETLEGRIRGKIREPVTTYVRKPGTTYASEKPPPAPNSPEAKAGGGV